MTAEYGVSKASISKWCEECQQNASKNPTAQNDLELMKENRRLREELADARKENLFLKKQRHSSQMESTRDISIHRWTSESVRRPVVAAAFWNLSECLLQLTKAQTSKSDRPKTGYPASIIDLHDRSVVASLTDRHMTSDLAIRTLGKALSGQRKKTKGLILYSDQGSPYTSKAFTDFCEEHDLTQSMSKAG